MARIPDSEIEQLKQEISVERLIEEAGIVLRKSGKDKIGLCPFHEDKEPSLVVTPAKNLWHCFGCQLGGGPIDWVMKRRGISFRHAVELLKTDPSLAAPLGQAPVKHAVVRSLPPPVAFDADDAALLQQTVAYYHDTLLHAPEALAYLKSRGIDHRDAIERFQLGYANRTLGLRLPIKAHKTGAEIRTQLQKIGIYRPSGHEHFNGSLVVPIFDEQGQVQEIYGRKIRDDLRRGTPKHVYLAEACRAGSRGVWNLDALKTHKDIILCEALIDALTFWCAGFQNVTCAYGVEGFTDDHRAAFQRYGIERVLIAYDRDTAGDRAAEALAPQLIEMGIECLRVQFPRGMDANAYALKLTPAHQSLALVLRQAEWIGRGNHPDSLPDALPVPISSSSENPLPSTPVKSATAVPENPSAFSPEFHPEHQSESPPEQQPPSQPLALAAALPLPPQEATAVASSVHEDEVLLQHGSREWRIRGYKKNLAPEQMRVNVQVRRRHPDGPVEGYHIDTLDLYAARARAAYVRQAALELGLPEDNIKRDMGHVLLQLEILQDEVIREQRQPQHKTPILSADDERAALALLQAPDLIGRIVSDMAACGVVGEAHNCLAGYLAAVSRKLDTPLAILIQSSSAAGKSSLMEAVLAMVPEEERIQYSAMTGQSLFYLGETDMQHKILAIAEEEGVRQAAYALKLLQSDGELTMASTGKDDVSGNLVTKQYRVKGPVMLMLTTTAIDVDEELMNRCLVLTVNESREQTRAIHVRQRLKQTLAGLLASQDKHALTSLHQNAQRLLKPVWVVNPYADQLTFLDDKTRMRRDHMKYLTLIRAIALLHQHQRPVKTIEHGGQQLAYIEASKDDIALANRIAHDVLGRTLDELPPQTRRLLSLVQAWVQQRCAEQELKPSDFRFTRREVRAATQWGDTQLKLHLSRLAELEYVRVHRRGTTFEYELVYDGHNDNQAHLCGLLDVAKLDYDKERSVRHGERSAPRRPLAGGWSVAGQSEANPTQQGAAPEIMPATVKPPIKGNGYPPREGVVPLALTPR